MGTIIPFLDGTEPVSQDWLDRAPEYKPRALYKRWDGAQWETLGDHHAALDWLWAQQRALVGKTR